jgi:hypothetical protein
VTSFNKANGWRVNLGQTAMDSAIASATFGGILTSTGLFFLLQGMKGQASKIRA